MDVARTLKDVSEIQGSEDNPRIVEMYRLCGHAEVKNDEVPWCAAFVGATLKLSGYKGTGSLLARSYEKFGEVLDKPVEGCLVVLWRKSKKSGSGHIGFYAGETSKGIQIFGGNQSDKVSVQTYPRNRLLAYVLPVKTDVLPTGSILPTILEVNAPNAPAHLKTGQNPMEAAPMPSNNDTLSRQFLSIHPAIEKWEGGYVDHPKDPGGATNMGITLGTLSKWRGRKVSKAEVQKLTSAEARLIFKTWYFDKVSGDQLPGPVALAVYNSGVLSGISRASKWLQQSVNSFGKNIDVDGEIGPETLGAVRQLNPQALASAYFDRYESFLKGLGTWGTFGKGWLNRLNDMRNIARSLPVLPAQAQPTQPKLASSAPSPSSKSPPDLTPVNAALGETIGKVLDGQKTGLGILGLLATNLLPILAPELAGALSMTSENGGTAWTSLLSALLAWGVLGKTEKWVKGK